MALLQRALILFNFQVSMPSSAYAAFFFFAFQLPLGA